MIYIGNINNHIKELRDKQKNIIFKLNEKCKILIKLYDKIHFYNNETSTFCALELKQIEYNKNQVIGLNSFPDNDENIPKNYNMVKICKLYFVLL